MIYLAGLLLIPTIILQRWIFNMRLVYFMKEDEIELCLAQFFLGAIILDTFDSGGKT